MITSTIAPASIFISNVNKIPYHTHNTYELLLMLSGKLLVTVNGQDTLVKEGDILLIDRMTLHSYTPVTECIHVVCQIDILALLNQEEASLPHFQVNSTLTPQNDTYHHLRHLIVKLIDAQSQNDRNTGSKGVLYEILSELILNFTAEDIVPYQSNDNANEDRQNALILYIMEHYRENLTMNLLAEEFNLSVPYLSAFFKKQIGITFTEYYNSIRLDRATNEMLALDDSIENIAHNNGFSDSRTFVKLFQNKYKMRPSAYRKIIKDSNPFPKAISRKGNLFHPSLPKSVYEPLLNQYREQRLPSTRHSVSGSESAVNRISYGTLAVSGQNTVSLKKIHKICLVDSFRDLLDANIQSTLRCLQKRVNFDYIGFDLISYFGQQDLDNTGSYSADNYYLADQILAFLNSIQLKPLFTLRLNLQDSTEKDEAGRPVYQKILIPEKTTLLEKHLRLFSHHLLCNYSSSFIEGIFFRIWLAPYESDLPVINPEEFFHSYKRFFTSLKNISGHFHIGSHSISIESETQREMNRKYVEFCTLNACHPDYYQFAYGERHFHNSKGIVRSIASPDDLSQLQQQLKDFRLDNNISDIPYCLFEFDMQHFHTTPFNDTCYKSCYMMHLYAKNISYSNLIGLWKLSDYTITRPFPSTLFHGGTGMFTYNGIAKPFLHVIVFLEQLGNKILDVKDGYIATADSDFKKITVIFYNYDFYRYATSHGERRNQSAFEDMKRTNYTLKLDKIDGDFYTMKHYSISESHGSVYDAWVAMGSPDSVSRSSMEFLSHIQTDLSVEIDKINNGIINLDVELEPLEVRLIELEIYSRN